MRVLFITRKWPPAMGGIETYSVELVSALRSQGVDVDLKALPGKPNGSAPGAASIVSFGLRTAISLLARRGDWAAVHGGDLAIWPLAALARLRNGRAPMVLSAHGTDISFAGRDGVTAWLYRQYLKACIAMLRRQNLTIAANSEATAALVRTLGFPKVQVIPLASRAAAPKGEKLPGRYLLFAGRLERRKGLSWLVDKVLPALPDDLRLVVAGTRWDASEEAALAHPRSEYLGQLDRARLATVMAGAVAVVAPNIALGRGHFEGFGLVAVEAAAAGAILLASDIDGFTSSVIDGRSGRLLPAGDASSWIAAIQEIAAWPPEKAEAARTLAQETAAAHFSWERVARETVELYGEKSGQGER